MRRPDDLRCGAGTPPAAAVVGVDIGGSKTAAGIVLADGSIIARAQILTPSAAGAAAVLDATAALIQRLLAEMPVELIGIGVGSAGVIDTDRGTVISSTDTFPGWAGIDLRSELASRTGVRVAVDNDVDTHALGELRAGAAREARNLVYIAVGTGVGAAIVHDRRLVSGSRHAAGEIGHLPTPLAGTRVCTCGVTGHLEAVAAGPAMVAHYTALSGTAVGGLPQVAAAADAGDPIAISVIREGGAALGQAIGGLLNVLDPDLVVIGGGVAQLGELWWDAVRTGIRTEAIPILRDTPVVAARLGTDAAILGAASLIWKEA
ncbi:ROK family protein [Nakamurella sp. A5-74]|uniref:ROK family protein n=1 Tax=Nakamurella sp. A5-74 TaxID=3158264 RepID=A0AAU8DQJ3_9ACTN